MGAIWGGGTDVATGWHGLLARMRRAVRAFESERTDTESMWTFRVLLERDDLDGGWVAECIDLPGCVSQGETEDETLRNIVTAITEVIAVRMEQQLPSASPDGSYDGGEARQVALSV